jgi:hypothetical protein
VVRVDLAAQDAVPGTISYDGNTTVGLPAGTTQGALLQEQQKVSADRLASASAAQAVSDTASADHLAAAQAQDTLVNAQTTAQADGLQLQQDQADLRGLPSGPARAAAQAKLAADNQTVAHDQTAVQLAAAGVATAVQHNIAAEHQVQAQLAGASATEAADQAVLATEQRTELAPGATFTYVPDAGRVIGQGQPVYALDGRPVPLLFGTVVAWRVLAPGVSDGPDVAQLNRALTTLGFESGGVPDEHFSDATEAGIRRLQASLGLEPTGWLRLGDVVFAPGPLRVSGVSVRPGAPAQPGSVVFTGTSTIEIATALIPLSEVGALKPGDRVTMDLPDGRTGIVGRVRDVGVATNPGGGTASNGGGGSPGNGPSPNGSAQGGANSAGNGASNGAANEPATIAFEDPAAVHGLDQAAVLVHITTSRARGVLAVPVTALLALAGGGEGVEVVQGNVHRIVAVTTGVFTATQVEVQGSGIGAGTEVEVPIT